MKILIIIFFCLTCHLLPGQNFDFFREDLTFQLRDDFFYVNGLYHFRNNTDKEIKTMLFYPIPEDSLYGKADEFRAICLKDSINQLSKANEKGFFFSVEIPAEDEQIYQIGYRQKVLGKQAEYIFTTTQSWGKPLEIANFELIFPTSAKLDSVSFLPDSLHIKNDNYHFFYHKKDFLPDKNFIIYFEGNK